MYKIIIASLLISLLCSCATPSYQKKIYQIVNGKPILIQEETKWDNSTFMFGKAIGLTIGYDPTVHMPTVVLRYGKWGSARILKGEKYKSDYQAKDVKLLTGSGTITDVIEIGDLEAIKPEDKAVENKTD